MVSIRRLLFPAVVVLVAGAILWPHVDRTATRVSLCVTGLGLVLAWYSILDLREQRKERFWPHTVDRLSRATFTAVTLVFVVNLAFDPPNGTTTIRESHGDGPPPTAGKLLFGEELASLATSGALDKAKLSEVVARHFANIRWRDGGSVYFSLLDGKFRFSLNNSSGGVVAGSTP